MSSSSPVAEPANYFKYGIVSLICLSTPLLLVISELKWLGWLMLVFCAAALLPNLASRFSRHMLILITMVGLLGVVPINTDISYSHTSIMGGALLLTIFVPYLLTSRVFKEKVITFPFSFGRKWYKREIAYVFFAGLVSYLILPFYLANTHSYLNWDVVLDPGHIIRLFLGTNALGIWDEQHLPFIWANVAQAALWTTFLYELGFRGWGPFAIFFFAMSQGYIFKKRKSLLYIITVHLTIDFMLFLVLIHLHHPEQLRIFITSPF
jgi:hypothetical protein